MIVQGRGQRLDDAHLSGLGMSVCDDSGCYDDGTTNISSGFPTGGDVTNPVPVFSQPTPVSAPVAASTSSGSWASQLNALFGPLTQAGAKILGARYAVPQLNAGQYVQTTPYGTTMYQQPTGVPVAASSSGLLGSNSSLIVIAGLGLLALVMFNRR